MNREIKFRAWNADDIEMYFPIVISFIEGKSLPLRHCKDGNRAYKHHALMQFTGLKDKNGVEIYEGDIVRIGDEQDDTINPLDTNTGIAQVVFMCGMWYVDGEISNGLWDLKQDYTNIEVIGNIYQTPDKV